MAEISAGSLLGRYRIEGVLGAGGMGHVYRARDTELGREVAIKTSEEQFTERFAREARAISALNHPNICTLYDVGPGYFVMELIEGESLAERLSGGPLPVEEALEIATQIAAALDVAHAKSVVHRDLKPANIRITPNGTVKVLDFGLARIARPNESRSPEAQLTRVGGVLGTPGYMAPEQVRGDPVDKRADIWAFGVVLHEMITGVRPRSSNVSGRRATATRPATAAGPKLIPANVERVLRHCLAEDPDERLRDIGDFGLLLEESSAADSAARGPSRRAFAGIVAGALGTAALGAWGWLRTPPQRAPQRARFTTMLPEGARVSRTAVGAPSLALSPDGRTLVIAVTDNTGLRLYRRGIGELVATPIAGTSGAMSPFWSPDGDRIGFYSDARLRYVPAEGGVPIDITSAPGAPAGASWGPDDRIVFTYGWRSPLHVVPASGGPAEIVEPLRADQGDIYMRRPQFLADGRHVILELTPQGVLAIDLENGQRVALLPQGNQTPRYTSGHLLAANGPNLLATPFDAQSLTVTGTPTLLAEGVAYDSGGGLHYAVAPNGTLAHASGADRFVLALTDLAGADERVLDEGVRYHRPRFGPRGERVAAGVRPEGRLGDDVWIYDTREGGSGTRLTFGGGTGPVWSPDGAAIAFAGEPFWTARQDTGLYTKNVDGRTEEQRLVSLSEFHRPIAWTPEQLLFELTTPEGEFWIERVVAGERQRVARGINARLSADGRLLAYVSDESGRDTVYVMAIDEGRARWQIAEGSDPVWAPDGTEVYYISGTRLMAAKLDFSAGVQVVSKRTLQDSFAVNVYGDYDVSPDGRSIVLIRPVDLALGRELTIALDWLA